MSLSGNARQVWSPAPTRAAVSLPDPLEIPGTNEAANNGPRQEGGSDGNSGEPGLSKDVADASSPLVSPTGSSWDLMNDSPDGSPRGDPPSRESGDGDGGGNDDDWEWDAISMSEMESRASSRCGSPGVRSVSSLAGSENDSSQVRASANATTERPLTLYLYARNVYQQLPEAFNCTAHRGAREESDPRYHSSHNIVKDETTNSCVYTNKYGSCKRLC